MRRRLCLYRIVCFGIACLALIASSGAVQAEGWQCHSSTETAIELEFTLPVLVIDSVSAGGAIYTTVDLAGFGTSTELGAPRLPRPRLLVELPSGAAWSLSIEAPEFREIPLSAPLLPLQPVRYRDAPEPPFALDVAAYGRTGFPPTPVASLREIGPVRQHRLALLEIDAVQYDPARQVLRVLDRAQIRVDLRPGTMPMAAAERERLRSPLFDAVIHRLAPNAPAPTYNPGIPVGLLVISAPELADDPLLAEMLARKSRRGLHVTHVSTDEIGGTATQIQAYIQNAYWTWAVPPTFVLLIGDTPEVPTWIGHGDDHPATDLYYGVTWGEPYEIFLPDISVGRLSVHTLPQLHNLLAKMLSYEEVGWTGNDTWERYAVFLAGEDHYGDNEGQWNAVIDAFLQPHGYSTDKLYCHTYDATSQQVRDALNEGRSICGYSGHGNETIWGDGPWFTCYDVHHLTNTVYPVIQSYSCLTGRYTYPECIGEAWIRAEHGGVAFYGATQVSPTLWDIIQSWYFSEGIFGAEAMGLVDQTWLGGMVLYAKVGFYVHMGGPEWIRSYIEEYNLLGDPSLDLWTSIPTSLPVAAPEAVTAGDTGLEVQVPGFVHAMVSAAKHDEADDFLANAWTDSTGRAVVSFGSPVAPGTLDLAAVAHDGRPWYGEALVIPSSGPYLRADSALVLDAMGDADGWLDGGETAGLTVRLENIGFHAATGVTGELQSADGSVEILSGHASFPEIAPGAVAGNTDLFEIRLSPGTQDQQVVPMRLTAGSAEGEWECDFELIAHAPRLQPMGELIDDSAASGNGDGIADPGETVYLYLWMENVGHADAPATIGRLSTSTAGVRILDAEGQCGSVPQGARQLLGAFQIAIGPECPAPSTIDLHGRVTAAGGFQNEFDYGLAVGAWRDDAESDRGWQLGAEGDDATAGVWVRLDPNGTVSGDQPVQPEDDHTPDPGKLCFVTGNCLSGYPAMRGDVDGGRTTLLTPVFALGDAMSAHIEYWRWFSNDLGENPGQDAWRVEVTSDGETWVTLEETVESANSWTWHTFNLEESIPLTNQVQIRFVAEDLAPESLVDAAVDDFTLTMVRRLPTDAPEGAAPLRADFLRLEPTPLQSTGRIRFVQSARGPIDLALYDVAGRRIRCLAGGVLGPGLHDVEFNGRDGTGHRLASGVYFLKLTSAAGTRSRQVAIVR